MKIANYLLTALFALSFVQIKAQCTAAGSHYTANPTGWNFTHISPAASAPSSNCEDNKQGSIYPWGTAVYFVTARGGREMRRSRDIPPVSNQSWTMDFTLHITPSAAAGGLQNNSPSVVLASLTNTQAPIMTGCSSGTTLCQSCINTSPTYQPSNVDAMWVELTSNAPTTCTDDTGPDGEYWMIYAYGRNAGSTPSGHAVSIPRGINATYYIRLQRTSATKAMLSVYSDPNYSMHVSGSPRCFDISQDISNLNALNHEVNAEGNCNRVFNGVVDHLKIDNGAACGIQPLAPSFTVPAVVCSGQPITVDASANIGQPIGSHEWGIVECDNLGNPLGQVIWSSYWDAPDALYSDPEWITEAANITCGKYYKIFLKVNNCNANATATRIIRIACGPSIRIPEETYVCPGESTTLSVGIRSGGGGNTIKWEAISPDYQLLSNGTNTGIVVAPTVTTTYQVTVYDNATGCSATGQVTVWAVVNDPSFSITNTLNASYYTISATPTDLYANYQPGFQYGWTIEELNAGTPYYWNSSMGGTTCWWNYPTPETFLGFVSTGFGTYIQSPGPSCGSAPGQFLYNHTYRITRLVLNEYCPAKQYSTIITTTKSGQVIAYQDKNAPDMTQMLGQGQPATDNITVSPNPSTGIFTIELEEETNASLIEVTDALGQKVKSFEAKGTRSELNLTGFTKGIYVITIVSNGSTTTKKIILE